MLTSETVIDWVKSQQYTSWRRNRHPFFFLQGNVPNHIRTRFYNIDSKKQIVLSPINYLVKSVDPPKDFDMLIDEAKAEIDIVDPERTITVEIDGAPCNGWIRQTSGRFFDHLGEKVFIDGYWLVLMLSEGTHYIKSLGTCRAGTIRIEGEYQIVSK